MADMTADGSADASMIAAAIAGATTAGVTFTVRDSDVFVPNSTQLAALDTYLKSAKWETATPFNDEHGACVRYYIGVPGTPYSWVALTVHVGADNGR